MKARPTRGQWAGYAAALFSSLGWGLGFPINKLLLTELSPLPVLILRFGVGALVYLVLLVVLQRGLPPLPRRATGRLLFVALAGTTLNATGITLAIDIVGPAASSLAIMLVPILTGLLAALAGQERLRARTIQGLLLALSGLLIVVLLGGPGASFAGAQLVGLLFLLAGALGFAIYNVYSRPLFASYSPLEVSGYVGVCAGLGLLALLVVPPVRLEFAAVRELSSRGWLLVGYLALLANVFVFLTWYWALRRLPATRVALFSYFIPVWGVSGSALLLQERITAWLPVGVALVVAGIVVSNRRADDAR